MGSRDSFFFFFQDITSLLFWELGGDGRCGSNPTGNKNDEGKTEKKKARKGKGRGRIQNCTDANGSRRPGGRGPSLARGACPPRSSRPPALSAARRRAVSRRRHRACCSRRGGRGARDCRTCADLPCRCGRRGRCDGGVRLPNRALHPCRRRGPKKWAREIGRFGN